MRTLLLCLCLFFSFKLCAQTASGKELTVEDISILEKKGRGSQLMFADRRNVIQSSGNFDVRYIRAEWTVDPGVRWIDGKVTIYYRMQTSGSNIALDLSQSLQVNLVTQRNIQLSILHQDDNLLISIPHTEVGVLDSLTINYSGNPGNSGIGSFNVTTHGSPSIPVMWTLSEPFGSKDWWPCKNGLNDKADEGVDLIITHPASYAGNTYRAAANGVLMEETNLPNGKVRTHWRHRYPIASYLVCFAITNYTLTTRHVLIDGVSLPVINYAYPESKVSFDAGIQHALDAMEFFSTELEPYPFISEKYGHVQFGWGGGMEHQTNSFMVNMDENLVAHELAHHWFGNKITCNSWHDIWLNEGFATYLANIYRENKYPSLKNSIRASGINNITSVPNGSVRVEDTTDVNRIFSGRLSYYKGAHLLYMLRWIMGDAPFLLALRNYLSDPLLSYSYARTSDLKRHLEAVAGKDLTYFFDQWYSGQGYPSYQLEWRKISSGVQFSLKQTTSHASVDFFQLPVPIMFRNNTTNQQKLVIADHTFSGQNFTELLGFVPETAQIDPEYWLISKNNTVTELTDPLPVYFSKISIDCSGAKASLNWQTSSEVNTHFFEIQKSTNAVQWEQIGKLDAAGNSGMGAAYSFTDPIPSSSVVYYRVMARDLDGSLQPTRILTNTCLFSEKLLIIPNPVSSTLRLNNLPAFDGYAKLQIWDQQGRRIRTLSLTYAEMVEGGVDLTFLAGGLYLLHPSIPGHNFPATLPFLKK
ncbi:M1 family metallopeptidase [Dyadobacter tibetensis]|uniref:M1 family metallopeptidase n=1 Tax=Dyadobacter tibetensis TaxID=1211851 RepID=UPI00046FB5A6|nr:M1 family metallopeptidase [Dyadobacter tibetensis]